MEKEHDNKAQKLAEDVFKDVRNTLYVNLRFLDMALSCLTRMSCEEYSFMTDGKYVLYNPKYILKDYKLKMFF